MQEAEAALKHRSVSAQDARSSAPHRFATTRWSVVFRAAQPDGGQALCQLCRSYWYPVYSFVRGHGLSAEDAADVTQGVFEKLLERQDIASLDPAKGQFRSWLRACARYYLCNWFAHRHTRKAGGQAAHVSIDVAAAEERLVFEDAGSLEPEKAFDRRWALTVLERALGEVRAQYERAGKSALFDHLEDTLAADQRSITDAELSLLLGKSVGAIKVERHRLKRRFQRCLRAEVAKTITGATRVDDEIRRLIDALA